jgi:hypothetical protein
MIIFSPCVAAFLRARCTCAAQAGLPEPLLAVFITLPDAEFESMLNELMESSVDE